MIDRYPNHPPDPDNRNNWLPLTPFYAVDACPMALLATYVSPVYLFTR